MRILVTGGTGFIGGWLTNNLLSRGFNVTSLDVQEFDKNSNFEHKQIDIRDNAKLRNHFRDNQFDAVVNLAALKSVVDSYAYESDYYACNFTAATNLYKIAKENNVKLFIQASSAAVYAESKNKLAEIDELDPISPYGSSKKAAEQGLLDLLDTMDSCRLVILRIFNVYGHESKISGKPNENFISRAIRNAMTNSRTEIFRASMPTPDETTIRDYVNVEDLVVCIGDILDQGLNFAENFPNVINIGSGEGTSSLRIAHLIREYVGGKSEISLGVSRSGDISISIADTERLKFFLPTLSFRTIETGIRQQIENYRR
jgi:UDP-glucose 4-epimerase